MDPSVRSDAFERRFSKVYRPLCTRRLLRCLKADSLRAGCTFELGHQMVTLVLVSAGCLLQCKLQRSDDRRARVLRSGMMIGARTAAVGSAIETCF